MDNKKNNMGVEKFLKQVYLAQNTPSPSREWKNDLMHKITCIKQETCAAEAAAASFEVKMWRFAWLSFAASAAAVLVVIGTVYLNGGASHTEDPAINVMSRISMLKDY
ncbi:hypothetical protein P0136_08000 [Lentisphaerota bacterium ZTH]|nr:hypothetical protein JYG24_00890 [Lentisphaerota bacterium]WET05306.1 hypothetical protein P0136_08000 [Lentisphaerota bacterium ZTH]